MPTGIFNQHLGIDFHPGAVSSIEPHHIHDDNPWQKYNTTTYTQN
jgi:hypothetical protein